MPRSLFEFMPDGEAGAEGDLSGGGQPAEVDAGAAVPVAEPAAPEDGAAPTATPVVDWDTLSQSPEFQERQRGQFDEWLNEVAAQQQEPDQYGQPHPFADVLEGFEALGIPPDRFTEFLNAQMAPLTQFAQQVETREQSAVIEQQLGHLAEKHPALFGEQAGELVGENRYATLSLGLALQQSAAAQGQNVSAGDALAQSAEWLAARDDKVRAAERARYTAELEGVADAPHDPSGNGLSAADSPAPAASEQDVVRRFMERQRAAA